MTAVEVCPRCDIAGCRHIRERQAMTAPERIWLQAKTGEPLASGDDWHRLKPDKTTEYILAASPEVQALVADAVATERKRCAAVAAAYCWNCYTNPKQGGFLSSPAVFTSHTHQDIAAAILDGHKPGK